MSDDCRPWPTLLKQWGLRGVKLDADDAGLPGQQAQVLAQGGDVGSLAQGHGDCAVHGFESLDHTSLAFQHFDT